MKKEDTKVRYDSFFNFFKNFVVVCMFAGCSKDHRVDEQGSCLHLHHMFGEEFISWHPMFHKPTFIFCLRLHNSKKHSCRRTMISTSFATLLRHLKEKFLGFIFLPKQSLTLLQFSLINKSGEKSEATSG